MPVPDTLHLSVSYLITPWGTIGMRDSLNKRERERERERGGKTRDEFESDSEGAQDGETGSGSWKG